MTVPPSDGNQGVVFVADACALLAYLRDEDGAQGMEDILIDRTATVYAHALNLSEVYYGILRESGRANAVEAIRQLEHDGVEAYEMMDKAFWLDVGDLKVTPGQLSLADCVAIALARRLACELLTADHHEMDKLVGTGLVDLRFIR